MGNIGCKEAPTTGVGAPVTFRDLLCCAEGSDVDLVEADSPSRTADRAGQVGLNLDLDRSADGRYRPAARLRQQTLP